jgi:hypothetical protein
MRLRILSLLGFLVFLSGGCVYVNKVTRHDFDSGFYELKSEGADPLDVYTSVKEDSIVIYPVILEGKVATPDVSSSVKSKISNIKPGDHFYKSCFVKNSIDVDLSTLLLKLRPPSKNVPNQLSYNVNAAMYCGLRKDFYKLIPYRSPLNEETSFVRQIGFDAGLFAGIGITPINPSVTEGNETLEYDGIVFQRGVAGFITIDRMSVGVSLGFDKLLDHNKNIWVYNNRPYIGLMIGILNF